MQVLQFRSAEELLLNGHHPMRSILHVGVVSGRGLIISWCNEQWVEQEEGVLSDSSLEAIKFKLRSIAGFRPEG